MNKYKVLKQKQEKELNEFPMAFAFSDEQFKEGMQKLGLTEHDTDKVYSIGLGGFIRKTDSKAYGDMFKRFDQELNAAIENDQTGEGFIKDMFSYELGNHEYCITYDLEPTLDALGLKLDQVNNSPTLKHGLQLARKEYLESAYY